MAKSRKAVRKRPSGRGRQENPSQGMEYGLKLLLDDVLDESAGAVPKSRMDITPVLMASRQYPMQFWGSGWVLRQIPDLKWRSMPSEGGMLFPTTLRADHIGHPAYVLNEVGNYIVRICPMSSSPRSSNLYISAGRKLDVTNWEMDKTSYLVISHVCNLSRSPATFEDLPQFLGVMPFEKLERAEDAYDLR